MSRIIKPQSTSELLEILNRNEDHRIIAGGTDIYIKIKEFRVRAEYYIDIFDIPGSGDIRKDGSFVSIGCCATHSAIISSDTIRTFFPELASACSEIGSVQIRNRGTAGGNIANASPAGDSIIPMIALGAEIELLSVSGAERILLKDFFTGPGSTVLKKNQFISRILIPAEKGKGVYIRLGQRKALAISKASIAVRENSSGYSICLGALNKTPLLAVKTMEILNKSRDIDRACIEISRECSPISDLRSTEHYRRKMAAVLLKRALDSLESRENHQ